MNISKVQWDRYVEKKRDLVVLERELADTEEQVDAAREIVAAFEAYRGIVYDPQSGMISFTDRPVIVVEDQSSREGPPNDEFDPF